MTLTAGVLSKVSVSDTTDSLSATAATSGTTPYTYQWYRSTTTAFAPGAGNLISGATSLTLNDSGLIPGTAYFYKVVVIDAAAASASYAQLAVSTIAPLVSQNLFTMAPYLGMLDLRFNPESVSVEIDSTQATSIAAGTAVKIVDSVGGIPKVIACTANSDEVLGFINFDIKSQSFAAGDKCEISMAGNFMYLYSTGAIARGVQVSLDITTAGGVRAAAGNTGDDIVGYAFDKATAGGQLIRIRIRTPSFSKV